MHQFYGVTEDGEDGPGVEAVPHLQGAITMFHYGMEEWRLIDGATPAEIARIQACKTRNSATWLCPSPQSVKPISDEACRTSHKARLGIHIHKNADKYVCACGTFVKDGSHFM